MKKIGRLIAFMGAAGAALAGLWYFLDQTKKVQNEDEEIEDMESDEETEEKRSYVSLDPATPEEASDIAKEALKKNVAEAISEANAKAEEAADGVGIVKEDKPVSEFKFESLEKPEEDKAEDKATDNTTDKEEDEKVDEK